MSERASPGGSTALWWNLIRRWVLVKVPSISATWAEGKKKTSVWMSSVRIEPSTTSGALYQKAAVSVSKLSLTTSQSSLPSAARWKRAFWPPTAGFCPMANMPRTRPSLMAIIIGMWEWSPEMRGMPGEAEVVLLGGRVAVHRLQIGDEELGGVGPVAGRQRLGLQVLLDACCAA